MKDNIREILSRRKKSITGEAELVPAAVLIPLLLKDNLLHLLLSVRTDTVEYHKGQISFPGGAFEQGDKNLLATALRETHEEVGIKPDDVEILGELDDLITTSNFIVTPFVGIIPHPYNYIISHHEVAELLEVPLSFFLDEGNMRSDKMEHHGHELDVYFFDYGSHTIWGVTARILKGFLDLLRSERSDMLQNIPFIAR